jgi:hypothetical protein
MQNNAPQPELVRFRPWARANIGGVSTAYRLVKEGKLRLTKIGKSSYVTRAEIQRFIKSLENPT